MTAYLEKKSFLSLLFLSSKIYNDMSLYSSKYVNLDFRLKFWQKKLINFPTFHN